MALGHVEMAMEGIGGTSSSKGSGGLYVQRQKLSACLSHRVVFPPS